MNNRKTGIDEHRLVELKEIFAYLNINPNNIAMDSPVLSSNGKNDFSIEPEDQIEGFVPAIDEDTLERIDFFGGLLRFLSDENYKVGSD